MELLKRLSILRRAVVGWVEVLGLPRHKRAAKEKEDRRIQRLQRTTNVYSDGVATIGFDGRFNTVSHNCEAILGYEPEELVGRSYLDMFHPDDRDRGAMLVTAIAAEATEVRLENRAQAGMKRGVRRRLDAREEFTNHRLHRPQNYYKDKRPAKCGFVTRSITRSILIGCGR